MLYAQNMYYLALTYYIHNSYLTRNFVLAVLFPKKFVLIMLVFFRIMHCTNICKVIIYYLEESYTTTNFIRKIFFQLYSNC